MRVTYDPACDAAYLHLTDEHHDPVRESVALPTPESAGPDAHIVMDWKDGRIVGLEVLDASQHLHRDLLDEAPQSG